MKLLDRLFLPKKKVREFTVKEYIKDLNNASFRDKFNLGLSEEKNNWLLKSFTLEPNAIFIGAMGSGKSVAANFTALTWMLSNSDQTIMFIIDTVKGATDYQALFECDQVFPVINSETNVHRVIDLVYDEAMARREAFSKVQAENIFEYERKTNSKLARVIILIEEFHAIPYNILNFDKDYKIPMTSANKFHTLMRIGRSMGTWVIACSQKATKSDIPSEIVPNFTQKQIFRVSKAEAAYFLSDTKAADIRTDQKGRCETDFGSIQFPFIPLESQKALIKKYVKPLEAKCCYLDESIIDNYLKGKSTEELYKLKKLSDLAVGIDNYDSELVIRILHKRLQHEIQEIDSKLDNFNISAIVNWPSKKNEQGKGRVAIVVRVGSKKITSKHIMNLAKGMDYHKCQRGILYTSAEDLPAALYKKAVEEGIEIVDHEDLVRMCRQIENKVKPPEEFDPSELADSSKESGDYQRELQIPDKIEEEEDEESLVQDIIDDGPVDQVPDGGLEDPSFEDEIEPVRVAPDAGARYTKEVSRTKVEEDEGDEEEFEEDFKDEPSEEESADDEVAKLAESMLVPTHRAAVKPVKRLPVRGYFHLQKDEPAELLIHLHRNDAGEVYRVLFSVAVNKKIRHQYFLDKKVQGDFSIKDRARLQIVDTKDWNEQYDEANRRPVMDDEAFNKAVLEYLDLFKQYEFGNIKAICWEEDADYVTNLVSKSRYMDPTPTKIEDVARSLYSEEVDRDLLLAQNKMNIKRIDLFYSINVDFEIWKMLSP